LILEEDRSAGGLALGAASGALYVASELGSEYESARGSPSPAAPQAAPTAAALTPEQEASAARVDELCQIIGSALAALAREVMGLPPRDNE
jgi:hypothetical protein